MASILVDATIPSPEEKMKYDMARKELQAALQRKRAIDKTLVCSPYFCGWFTSADARNLLRQS